MKVVLNEDVEHLGYRGDIVNVAKGYARNFLLPKKLALPATPGNLKQIAHKRRAWAALEERDAAQARELAARLAEVSLSVTKKAGETETLYGSVTSSEIAGLLESKGIEIDRRKIQLKEPIKTLGSHTVTVKLHRDVQGQVRIEVVPEQPVAEPPREAPAAEAAESPAETPAEPAEE